MSKIRLNFTGDRQQMVLIIDPLPVFCRILHKLIQIQIPHANITVTDDIEQAFVTIEREPVDIVFLDIAIFPKNCIDHIRSIRRQLPSSLIVVLTTHDSAEHKKASLKNGADYFFSKTDSFGFSLIEKVKKILS